jgi:hypothetical protein
VDHHDVVALACGIGVIGLIAYVRYALGCPWLSASTVYLMLFWMFHYGLAFPAALAPDVLLSWDAWDIAWLHWPNVRMAMILGVVGASGFVFGLGITSRRFPRPARIDVPGHHDAALYGVGWLVMLAGIAGTAAALAMHGGLGVFAMSYEEFRETLLSGRLLQSGVDVSQLGCLLAICGAGGRRWVTPLAAWGASIGLLMLVIGMRSEAMVPVVSFAIVLVCRGNRLPRGLLAAGVAAAFVAMPAIKTFRQVGLTNRDLVNWTRISPLDTFTELGGTLRAAKTYVDVVEQDGIYLLGASYWAPFDRQVIARLMPHRERVPYEEDERIPGRLVPEREGAVGTSATGEAYANFGPFGPFVYFALVGALFGWLERQAVAGPYGCACLGIAMMLFYFNIRSEWLALPAQATVALIAVGICYWLRVGVSRRPS